MPARPSPSDQVLKAIADLCLTEPTRLARRDAVVQATGLPLGVVDEQLKKLRHDEKIRLVERGVYVPVPVQREDRAVSATAMPDGTFKLEIGDLVDELTPREARALGDLFGGGLLLRVSSLAAR